jgi:Luciferase
MTADPIELRIQREVSSWPGVRVEGHLGGVVFFHVGQREIGHLHGRRFADIPFPVRIREELVAAGKADLHYLHPDSGWITYRIRGEEDFAPLVELFRLNYGRPWLAAAAGARGA